MKTLEFPQVVKAAKAEIAAETANQAATWRLADAVLKSAPDLKTDNSPIKTTAIFERMARELKRHAGREYSVHRLMQFWRTAEAFPPAKRKAGVSFEICSEAVTPENLAAITRAATAMKRERPVSTRDVRKIVKAHKQKHTATPRSERPSLTDADATVFFETANIWGDLASVLVKLRTVEKNLTPDLVAQLSDAMIAGCSEDCDRGIEMFHSIRDRLREHSKKGSHLTVVA